MLVAPSILSADFSRLGEEIRNITDAGADWIHLDVMDGQFVPNLTFGPPVIKNIRSSSSKLFDVHLMIIKPEDLLQDFIKAGADSITFHIESTDKPDEIIKILKKNKVKVGITLNPQTKVETLKPFLKDVDLVLVMTVNPGFGGQTFMYDMISKIQELKKWRDEDNENLTYLIQVDGGVNKKTIEDVRSAGGDVVVAGSFVSKHPSYSDAIKLLQGTE